MSRAEAPARIVEAAIALGAERGVAALSLQGVATAAGVSKALVLYHFGDKERLLHAIAAAVVDADVAALHTAATAADPLEAWRALAADGAARGRRALLAGLLHDVALQAEAEALTARRAGAAMAVAGAVLQSAGLRPRIAPPLLGRVLLHQLDGLAAAGVGRQGPALDADVDALALALLGLGR